MSFSQFSYKYTADANVPLSEERLVAYCQRIGIDLNVLRSTSVETIRLVMQHHVRSIPFENLAVLQQLSSPAVSIDFDDVFRKLVVQRRGGYCFEQNYLLMVVFQTIGFQKVAPISARVRLRDPFNRAWIPPRTHFFLVITLDDNIGDYIVDCGLGSPSLSAPLPLLLNVEQDTGCDSRRITKTGTSFFHEYRIAGASEWRDVCEFTGEEMPEIDRVVSNWFCCNHAQSHFRGRLTVARNTLDGRLAILNNEFSIRHLADNRVEKVEIRTREQLLEILKQHFGLEFPAGTDFPCSGLVWN